MVSGFDLPRTARAAPERKEPADRRAKRLMSLRRAHAAMMLAASWSDLFTGTEAAPWIWWALALVVLVVGLLLGMRMLGLFPE